MALQPTKDTAPVKLVLTTQHVLVILFFDVLQADGAGKGVNIYDWLFAVLLPSGVNHILVPFAFKAPQFAALHNPHDKSFALAIRTDNFLLSSRLKNDLFLWFFLPLIIVLHLLLPLLQFILVFALSFFPHCDDGLDI